MSNTLLQRVEEQAPLETRPPVEPQRRVGPTTMVLVGLLLVAVIAGVVAALTMSGSEETGVPSPQAQPLDEDEVLRQLVNQGYIPKEAFDAETYWTEWAQARGFVPTHAHPSALYTPEELETMRLVREGALPEALLRSETFVTKRLVNEGLLPPAAAR
jgi:hypothetical protein